jgi:acyl-CoA synthetase (AMP-forming)/AMP-acid ligase II
VRSIADVVRWRAGQQGRSAALTHDGRRTSFAELERRSSQVAQALIRAGVKPGDRVCALDKNHDALIALLFGCAKAGAVYTPVNWRLAPPEIRFVFDDARAPLVCVGQEFAPAVSAIAASLAHAPRIVRWGEGPAEWTEWDAFLAGATDADPRRDVPAGETAWQLYTSGTTGHPKGAELTHANLLTTCAAGLIGFGGAAAGDVALVCMPLYHIGGSGYATVMLYAGCELIVQREARPDAILTAITRHGVQHAFLVPALIGFVLDHPDCARSDFSRLRTILYGASPIPEALLVRAIETFRCNLVQAYGLTETSGATVTLGPDEHWPGNPRLRSCGKPNPWTELRILDGEGRECASGEVGEIAMRGPLIMRGYWNRPDATAEVLRDGWFRSGDAGYLDADGFLYIHDRVKDMILSGGENVYPAEVESAIYAHPGVADVAVIGVPDERWGEAVKAVVVRNPGSNVSEQEILDFCRERIAGFKRPRSVDFVDALPRNPTGKLLKRELRAPYWKGRERNVN